MRFPEIVFEFPCINEVLDLACITAVVTEKEQECQLVPNGATKLCTTIRKDQISRKIYRGKTNSRT